MTDYPDWQTFPNAQSDNLFATFTSTYSPGLQEGTLFPALSWSSLIVIVEPSAGAGQVQVSHFADAAATQVIDSDSWPVNGDTSLVVRTPLRGKYVRIDINVTSPGDMTTQHWANFLSASSDRISFPVSQQNLSAFDLVVAASATETATSGEICAGQALFYFTPYDTTGKLTVSIHAVDENGNSTQLIADFGAPKAIIQQVILVPDLIIQVEIDNTDATASHTCDFSLTVPPQ